MKTLILILFFTFTWPCASEEMTGNFIEHFIVRVVNQNANVFSSEGEVGHGTGFLAELKTLKDGKQVGIVFTNRHVVEYNTLEVQQLTIEFNSETKIPDKARARPIYVSKVHDFAILEVDLDDLKPEVRESLIVAKFPSADDPILDYQRNYQLFQGLSVMALGNPFDATNIVTYGLISGISEDIMDGYYIQTQTPINPGNSGGPLITEESLEVIGINTATIVGGNSIGYSIPIGVLLEEYNLWKAQPGIAVTKSILIFFGLNPKSELDMLGVSEVLAENVPEYFQHYEGTLRIQDAHPSTGLKSGDQVIKVSDAFLGMSIYEYKKLMYFLPEDQSTLKFLIIRDHKMMEVDVPIRRTEFQDKRFDVDYVHLSGLIFQERGGYARWTMGVNDLSSVFISSIKESNEMNFGASRFPTKGSLLTGVSIENEFFEIKKLIDLKLALNSYPNSKSVKLHMKDALVVLYENVLIAVQDDFGQPMIGPLVKTYVVPNHKYYTPFQFSIHQFKKHYDFTQAGFKTRDVSNFLNLERRPSAYIKALSCSQKLKGNDE